MLPIISIGPAAFPVSGLVILAGIWIGLILAERSSESRGISANDLNNLVFISAITGLLSARIGFIIENFKMFTPDPLSALSLRPVYLDAVIGAFAALISAAIYAQRKQLPAGNLLDALTPFFAVFWISMGLANLASGSAFGSTTELPWGIFLWGEVRHPTQIYHIITSVLILVLLFPGSGVLCSSKPGITFLQFSALTSASALLIEGFRGDSSLIFSGIRQNQLFAWLILATSLFILAYVQFHQKKPHREVENE